MERNPRRTLGQIQWLSESYEENRGDFRHMVAGTFYLPFLETAHSKTFPQPRFNQRGGVAVQ